MKPETPLAVFISLLSLQLFAQTPDMDTELSSLAQKLGAAVKANGKKKVTVLDFTDLKGGASELGRYVAEQITVDLVMNKKDFAVLDRANLKSILAEHKLTATGLINPETAKKLGMFAGVDALILGNIIPKGNRVALTAKIITTDTAEIVGAAKAEFQSDETVKKLDSEAAIEENPVPGEKLKKEIPDVTKSFGDLRLAVHALQIVNGNQYLLSFDFTNAGKRSIWVALSAELMGMIKGRLTDPEGNEFQPDLHSLSGISSAAFARYGYVPNSFSPATELQPGDSISASLKFASVNSRPATPGKCRLQMELLVGKAYTSAAVGVTMPNFVHEVEAR